MGEVGVGVAGVHNNRAVEAEGWRGGEGGRSQQRACAAQMNGTAR